MSETQGGSGDLDVLLQTEQTFPPPPDFAAQANASDPEIYERADRGPRGLVGLVGREARVDRALGRGPRLVRPAVREVVRRRQAQRLRQLPRPPRRRRQRRARRLPLGGRGRDQARDHLRLAAGGDAADRQRPQGRSGSARATSSGSSCRWSPRRRWRCSPAPGSARSTTSSSAASRANSVTERMEVSDAKALITADATLRRGQPTPMKSAVDEILDGLPEMEHVVVVDRCGTNPPMTEGRDHFWHELVEAADAGLPAGGDGRRGPALHPLHLGLDREAEGDPAHHRRLPDRGHRHPQARLRSQGRRRLLVRGRHRLGHRPLLHRLRPARQRRDQRHVRGRARTTRPRTAGGRSSSATASRSSTRRRPRSGPA